jgi:hypothetical protein
MKKISIVVFGVLFLLLAGVNTSRGQVKRVEMKIDGYLCGN